MFVNGKYLSNAKHIVLYPTAETFIALILDLEPRDPKEATTTTKQLCVNLVVRNIGRKLSN